jgi:hypothetical protein
MELHRHVRLRILWAIWIRSFDINEPLGRIGTTLWIACSDCKCVARKVIGNLATRGPAGRRQVTWDRGSGFIYRFFPAPISSLKAWIDLVPAPVETLKLTKNNNCSA